MKKVTAIIMASGLSQRFGSNKLQTNFGGQMLGTIIQNQLLKLKNDCSAKYITDIILVTTTEAAAVSPNIRVIINKQPTLGQSHSLVLGLQATGSVDGVLFLNADQPFLNKKIILALLEEFFRTDKIIVPQVNGQPQSPCIFPQRFFPLLLKIRGDKGGREIYQSHLSETVFLDFPDENYFFDIDTPEDFKTAIKILQRK